MHKFARGIIAALLFSALQCVGPVVGLAQLAPGGSTLADGLTVQVRQLRSSPTAAIEVWLGVPSDGYGESKPGIARLAALSIVYEAFNGKSLRDLARDSSGQLTITVYPASSEIAIVVPSYDAPAVERALLDRVFHPAIDVKAFADARQRLAAQQAAYLGATDLVLRDAVFSVLFSSGAYHVSSYGASSSLDQISIEDLRSFLSKGYVAGNAILVAAGDVDQAGVLRLAASQAPLPAPVTQVPAAVLAAKPGATIIANSQADGSGVALAWAGPPISDERAATAMDFLSDYLLRPDYGVVAAAVKLKNPGISVGGEFVTLKNPGVFYVTASGPDVDAGLTIRLLRDAMNGALAVALSGSQFARAIQAYRTHALRDNSDGAQTVADNFGWYFVHGAPAYSPSATDANLSGDYFAQVAALTPQYVEEIARRYLSSVPATAAIAPHAPTAADTLRASPTRGGK